MRQFTTMSYSFKIYRLINMLTPDYLFKFEHIESKEVLIDTINNKLETFDLEKIKLIARIIDDIII